MKTPICDFVKNYADGDTLRLHMPGHKGSPLLGIEPLDITEIDGADSLYDADGIIAESEKNASALFGCTTFYSTEGSSHGIRAMLHLLGLFARTTGKKPTVAAARNVHKSFLSAVALLDIEVTWLYPDKTDAYLSCKLTAAEIDAAITAMAEKPTAVYLTSPDYLGNTADIAAIAAVCHRHGVLLLVDNAHGAYLRFLPASRHPIDLGADMCCDSAHKTLSALTGGAYLHISPAAPTIFTEQAKNALALFGSTSPSYLILQSLDAVNAELSADYPARLAAFLVTVGELGARLREYGYQLIGDEPLKLTLRTKPVGYDGRQFACILREHGIECEFADPDFVVMMLAPAIGEDRLARLQTVLTTVPLLPALSDEPPIFHRLTAAMTAREATLAPCETIPTAACVGRVLAAPSVSCPPAVPIAVCGERMSETTAACFAYYGIDTCTVVIE